VQLAAQPYRSNPEQPAAGPGNQLAGALAVNMPSVQRVPNVPTTAIELARPDFDQPKAAKVVDSISVSDGQDDN
jgi:hypothetical protein